MNKVEEEMHVGEILENYGSAVLSGQLLEINIVNTLVTLKLLPEYIYTFNHEEWVSKLDEFMNSRFERTMGTLINELKSVLKSNEEVPGITKEFQESLESALKKRNWLVHSYFRERYIDIFSFSGRIRMIAELKEFKVQFNEVDRTLDMIMTPIRNNIGLTDERMNAELFKFLTTNKFIDNK